ncbi:hypothetical protein F5B20DRAFT_561438 [Whalleya microplaca]|nr:hypothetical protein F5B20DRAFT_561438 [Whalleya microplaca]
MLPAAKGGLIIMLRSWTIVQSCCLKLQVVISNRRLKACLFESSSELKRQGITLRRVEFRGNADDHFELRKSKENKLFQKKRFLLGEIRGQSSQEGDKETILVLGNCRDI